jgi:hypothetical protein
MNYRMPLLVRLSDARAADDLLADLRGAEVSARRTAPRALVVRSDPEHEEALLELSFFLRAWTLSRPGVELELVELPAAC